MVAFDVDSYRWLFEWQGCSSSQVVTLMLRGANDFVLDEMDRSMNDAICVVKRVLESKTVVPGGGAVEAALSIYLENFATTIGSREQLAIAEFADALLTIPKTLAVNAAQDATELVAKLRAYHHAAQSNPDKSHLSRFGLDLIQGVLRDNVKAGVLEPAISKVKMLQVRVRVLLLGFYSILIFSSVKSDNSMQFSNGSLIRVVSES